MGSATAKARAGIDEALGNLPEARLDDARALFQASRAIERSASLQSALVDPVAKPEARAALAERVLGTAAPAARSVVASLARSRWSKPDDLLAAIDEAAIRVAVRASGEADVAGDITAFERVVASDPELELALGGALGQPDAKAALVERLLAGRTSEAAGVILDHVVRSSRSKRIRQTLRQTAVTVAAASGRSLATVTAASELPKEQLERLRAGLERQYGRTLQLQQIIDPTVLGGLRVSVGDDIIDGTVRSKFTDLRLQLG